MDKNNRSGKQKLAVSRGLRLDFPIDIPLEMVKNHVSVVHNARLIAEFSGAWPGKRGTQFFGANPPGGRAKNLLPEPCS